MEVLFHPWPLPPLFLWKILYLYLLERLTSNAIFAKIVIFFKSLKSGKRLESPSNYFFRKRCRAPEPWKTVDKGKHSQLAEWMIYVNIACEKWIII